MRHLQKFISCVVVVVGVSFRINFDSIDFCFYEKSSWFDSLERMWSDRNSLHVHHLSIFSILYIFKSIGSLVRMLRLFVRCIFCYWLVDSWVARLGVLCTAFDFHPFPPPHTHTPPRLRLHTHIHTYIYIYILIYLKNLPGPCRTAAPANTPAPRPAPRTPPATAARARRERC